ncbi:MAG: M50 family metallopeptidase, partial [Bacillota bacterium]|nr:M50 family metallopeptidase [Bacillota bacterium]
MRIGRFLGVGFRVNNLFLLVLLLAGLAGRLEQVLFLFLAVFLHELGHVAAARSRGLSVREIELLPFGGVARVDDFLELDPAVERAVALAGPCTSFFLAGGLLLARKYGLLERSQADFLLGCNLMVAAFNLIPALPLDGGRIYRAHLVGRMGFRRATEQAAAVGKAMAALLA